jgi:signal transduction histidine kinase
LRAPVVGYGWVRLLPMGGAIGFVALLHVPQAEPSGWDWLFAVASAALVPAGGRLPVHVALAQCLLLALAVPASAEIGGGVAQILTCVALGEVALRRPGAKTWWSAAAVGAATACSYFPLYSFAANLLIVVLDVGLPLLLGSFLRSLRELASQAERRAQEAEQNRAWETKAARAAERAAVARELHDVVAHHVSSIVLRVGVVRHVVPSVDPRLDDALEDVHAIGGQALADLRSLVSVLRDPDTVGEPVLLTASGLSAELDTVVERTRQAGAQVATAVDDRAVDGLDTAHRHAVLRLVQEGLTNVLKHAGPGASARLMICRDDDARVRVEVSDDGGGAGPVGGADPGHGLIVMRERLELLGGELHVGPSGTGWRLRAVLPDAARSTPAASSASATARVAS